ncbi:hypothetical protein [Salipiger abyssi]|uniref:Uncharacterized protein n=1 Tax=Salipiger abyssi TaxID=1250539 RepID=A0A1P8UZT0_9RHOB|nr:hypothetical protein [Salipiger abyssi]APZ54887.1 hypothetical protein Ga0080574_TMP4553 [Salipiger abyssi]
MSHTSPQTDACATGSRFPGQTGTAGGLRARHLRNAAGRVPGRIGTEDGEGTA